MFLIVQLPFADLRGLATDQFGRLPKPDWRAVEHPEAFIRGFGKMASRNDTGYGLYGERAFVDFNHAARFTNKLSYEKPDWPRQLNIHPWFRRLYFDGFISGRFEFGFYVFSDQEDYIFEYDKGSPVIIPELIHVINEARVKVYSENGSHQGDAALGRCGELLGLSYIRSTTSQKIITYSPNEIHGTHFCVGKPSFYLRLPPSVTVERSNDENVIVKQDTHELYITSAGSSNRNNVIVQTTNSASEAAHERAIRVLFSNFNSLIYASSNLIRITPEGITAPKKKIIIDTMNNTLARLSDLRLNTPKDSSDPQFINAMKAFSDAHAGKAKELSEQIEALAQKLNEPSTLQKLGGGAVDIFKDVLAEVIKATMKGMVGSA